MLLAILMTIFGLIATYEGCFFLTHLHKPFLIFHPKQHSALSKALLVWGTILLVIGILAITAAWTNSIFFIVTMVVIGCICETLMAYSLMGYFQAEQRKN
ncbi:hypothetical protein [Limosilactobacillus fastidiosus]|uniref:Uncharacterized protein n=1 Tax=Limosilactobacillus fastidiosus TaxID=2759855 RepID=A0A7W3YBW3_9LACO|nr:hypothetical protein [Limosilactobacillus fastidiosus]MBB1063049.1 hypothetical protein [Limosilactobacillus fastidiosus]MBB1085698.1 hypothetical protein [Limosilactobacillus fastidiosus]MCD7083870.1 hypothetical protein [Limosilactobacillus fastidiosus]MCD7086177.1 hypothetical protein [Limosilactobacillus fastidiosus]MCD7114038.1 hypothetical protein [Limosilactobacillus fastidiosus]